MEIYVVVNQDQYDFAKRFHRYFGYMAHNFAVMLAPYDTGNLRSSITLTQNTSRRKQVRYNTMIANYAIFLEKGQGAVKKHKGFISEDTSLAIAEGTVNMILTGDYPFFSFIPEVELRDTENLFHREKQILKAHDIKTSKISADIRKNISRLRERSYRQSKGIKDFSVRGLGIETTKNYAYGSNKGNSSLTKSYTRLRKGE